MRDRIFYTSCFGFIVGVLLRSFIFKNLYFAILFGIIAFVFIIFFIFISTNKWGIITSIFILVFSFGVFRFHMVDVPAPNVFESYVCQEVILSGEIIDEPNVAENNQKLTVKVLAPQGLALEPLKARPFPAKTEILISTNLDENYKYGDGINFEGILKRPKNFITDQGKEFDYVNYLRKDGIFYVMNYPKIEVISHRNGNFIKSALFYAKEKFLDKDCPPVILSIISKLANLTAFLVVTFNVKK